MFMTCVYCLWTCWWWSFTHSNIWEKLLLLPACMLAHKSECYHEDVSARQSVTVLPAREQKQWKIISMTKYTAWRACKKYHSRRNNAQQKILALRSLKTQCCPVKNPGASFAIVCQYNDRARQPELRMREYRQIVKKTTYRGKGTVLEHVRSEKKN